MTWGVPSLRAIAKIKSFAEHRSHVRNNLGLPEPVCFSFRRAGETRFHSMVIWAVVGGVWPWGVCSSVLSTEEEMRVVDLSRLSSVLYRVAEREIASPNLRDGGSLKPARLFAREGESGQDCSGDAWSKTGVEVCCVSPRSRSKTSLASSEHSQNMLARE